MIKFLLASQGAFSKAKMVKKNQSKPGSGKTEKKLAHHNTPSSIFFLSYWSWLAGDNDNDESAEYVDSSEEDEDCSDSSSSSEEEVQYDNLASRINADLTESNDNEEGVEEKAEHDKVVVIDDMRLTKPQLTQLEHGGAGSEEEGYLGQRNAIDREDKKWANGIIPYEFHKNVGESV